MFRLEVGPTSCTLFHFLLMGQIDSSQQFYDHFILSVRLFWFFKGTCYVFLKLLANLGEKKKKISYQTDLWSKDT